MLDSMATVTSAHPINVVVNTHANGDHCYGNSLVAGDNGAQIITTDAAAVEMEAIPPSALAALMHIDINEETNAYIKDAFGSFDFTGIELPAPDRTFSGELQLDVGGRTVELIEVGPATPLETYWYICLMLQRSFVATFFSLTELRLSGMGL